MLADAIGKITVTLDEFADTWQKKAQDRAVDCLVYHSPADSYLYNRMIVCGTLGATYEANKFWITVY